MSRSIGRGRWASRPRPAAWVPIAWAAAAPAWAAAAIAGSLLLALVASGVASAAGPPFPDPVENQAVYDTAEVLDAATEAAVEATIDDIEARTGAEIAVYTQVVDYGVDTEDAEYHAQALMDQWGVGRAGFDDGLVILFDMDPSLCHGQVQLYAGPGYRAAYLTNGERQSIFDNDMLPYLQRCDMDGALLAAMERIDAAATPEHAAMLNLARFIDAAAGLVLAPLIFILVVGLALWQWRRYGKDPVYLDDPSIHIPAPPPDLTPASGALIDEGRSTRRALTTAMLDLASRGYVAFNEEPGFLGSKVGVELDPVYPDDVKEAYERSMAARQPLGPAERRLQRDLEGLDRENPGYIEPSELLKLGEKVSGFQEALEDHVVTKGWFREAPRRAMNRWFVIGALVAMAGGLGIFAGLMLESAGFFLVGISAVAAGVITLLIAPFMPAVTLPGAMIRAMLAAYRRTLEKTMAQARSMDQVVDEAHLPGIDTPDRAVVWGVALGLGSRVEDVLKRTLDDIRDGRALTPAYLPVWYHTGGVGSGGGWSGGPSSPTSGLFSSSGVVPNFGGMMAVLGTIGNSPSSSGGGGFGGGGSGGGGGGAGGGF